MAVLRQRLAEIPGIRSVETNVVTGSVLVTFDPEQAQSLGFLAQVCEALDISPVDIDPSLLEAFRSGTTNESLISVEESGQEINWGLLVPSILATLGFWSLMKSPATGPTWYDYFWFAFGSYFMLNPDARTPKPTPLTPVQGDEGQDGH